MPKELTCSRQRARSSRDQVCALPSRGSLQTLTTPSCAHCFRSSSSRFPTCVPTYILYSLQTTNCAAKLRFDVQIYTMRRGCSVWAPFAGVRHHRIKRQGDDCHRKTGRRAAVASSKRVLGSVCGAWRTDSGSSSISSSMARITDTKRSSVSFDSVSVGSTMRASGTMSGKYIVGAWMP